MSVKIVCDFCTASFTEVSPAYEGGPTPPPPPVFKVGNGRDICSNCCTTVVKNMVESGAFTAKDIHNLYTGAYNQKPEPAKPQPAGHSAAARQIFGKLNDILSGIKSGAAAEPEDVVMTPEEEAEASALADDFHKFVADSLSGKQARPQQQKVPPPVKSARKVIPDAYRVDMYRNPRDTEEAVISMRFDRLPDADDWVAAHNNENLGFHYVRTNPDGKAFYAADFFFDADEGGWDVTWKPVAFAEDAKRDP